MKTHEIDSDYIRMLHDRQQERLYAPEPEEPEPFNWTPVLAPVSWLIRGAIRVYDAIVMAVQR